VPDACQVLAKCVPNARRMRGQMHTKCMLNARQTRAKRVPTACRMCGKCVPNACRMRARCVAHPVMRLRFWAQVIIHCHRTARHRPTRAAPGGAAGAAFRHIRHSLGARAGPRAPGASAFRPGRGNQIAAYPRVSRAKLPVPR
jgi:hypothetical protein